MSLISLFADLSGLTMAVRENTSVLVRIAEALERVSPPLPPAPDVVGHDVDDNVSAAGFSQQATVAETPAEYEARSSWEYDLALSLGMAPWSPQVQVLLHEMRQELMKPKMVPDEEGTGQREIALTEAEAVQAIRDAFQEAIGQANTRQ